MRGITFVLVPTLSLVNMGVNGASIGNILGQRGDGAKLGASTQAARQYHTADFSNSDSGAHKGAVAHRALLDTLTPATVLSSADTDSSIATNGTTVQSVSPRVDVAQNELTALSEDVQNTATAIPRQVSFDAPSLTNSLAPNTISSGDGLTSVTGVGSLRRAENTKDNAAVCSKHKKSLDARALEITKTSAADPIDISNVDGGLALRAQHARQVPTVPFPVAGLPVVGPVVGGNLPRSVDARALELFAFGGSTKMLDSVIDNGVRDLTVTPTFNRNPILGEASLGAGTLPTASSIVTSISGLKEGNTPAVGTSDGNPALPLGGSGLPTFPFLDGSGLPVIKTVGVDSVSSSEGSGLPAVIFEPVNFGSPGADLPIPGYPVASPVPAPGSSMSVVGSSGGNSVPILGGGFSVPVVASNVDNTGGIGSNPLSILGGFGAPAIGSGPGRTGSTSSNSRPLLGESDAPVVVPTTSNPVPVLGGRSSGSGTGGIESSIAQDVVDEIAENTARGLTDTLNSFPVLGSRTVKRDASITLNALQPSLTALFSRQEDTTSDASDDTADSAADSGDASDSTDEATSSADAATIARRQTSESTDGTDAAGDSTDNDSTDSGDALDPSDATTTATRRQTLDDSSDASDPGDATGDSTDSSDADDVSDSSDAATASVTRRQSTDDSADASDSTAGEATDSADTSGSSDADATASSTRRQTTDESTDASDSNDASGDSTDSADSDDALATSDATTVAVTRRQTIDDSTGASDSGDANDDSTDAADSDDASGSDSSDSTVTAARRQTTDDSVDASESSDTSGDSGADSAEASGDSTDAGKSSDASVSVKRRQGTSDNGSSSSEEATANDEDDASTTVSTDGDESTSTDSSEEAAARRRALGFKLTPSQLRNRMTMRKVRRQDNVDIDDADVDASSVSTEASNDAATDAPATEESLDNLD